jgi:NADPH2:quinone reductase
MRVIEVESPGGPEVLNVAEHPPPQPGPGQIVAQIAADGVNYMDIYQREGVGGYRPPLPFVTGGEGAGTVIAMGKGVTSPSAGDRVAWVGPGQLRRTGRPAR